MGATETRRRVRKQLNGHRSPMGATYDVSLPYAPVHWLSVPLLCGRRYCASHSSGGATELRVCVASAFQPSATTLRWFQTHPAAADRGQPMSASTAMVLRREEEVRGTLHPCARSHGTANPARSHHMRLVAAPGCSSAVAGGTNTTPLCGR